MINIILAGNSRQTNCCPMFIYYISAGVELMLAKKGLGARCVDLTLNRQGDSLALLDHNQEDIYVYPVFFENKSNAFQHMTKVRRAPKAPRLIIAYGPFASVFSDEILLRGLADIVVSHDPEFVIPAILQEGDRRMIPNLSYLEGGNIVHTPKRSFSNLDEIPFVGTYLYRQGYRPASILAVRGCRRHCLFCDRNVLWGGDVRKRSIPNVLAEIEELIRIKGVDEFEFLDEDLVADHQYLIALCKGISGIKGEFRWACSASIDSVNRELLLLMRLSRCREIYFGVESASPQVLRRMGKTYGSKEIFKALRWAQEAGMKVEIMVTTGNPGETIQDRNLTTSMLKVLGPQVRCFSYRLLILPGTGFFRKGLQEGWFSRESYFEAENLIYYDEKEQGRSESIQENKY